MVIPDVRMQENNMRKCFAFVSVYTLQLQLAARS